MLRQADDQAGSNVPTFKWSRDNGAVAFVITEVDGSESPWTITLQDLGRDGRFSLDVGDWVEIVLPLTKLTDGADAPDLLRVTAIDPVDRSVTVERPLAQGVAGVPDRIAFDANQIATQRPLLRRWDQRHGVTDTREKAGSPVGAIPITFAMQRPTAKDSKGWADDPATWFPLEDGIQVQFQRPTPEYPTDVPTATAPTNNTVNPKVAAPAGATFRAGDYWLIPARTASNGFILWPETKTDPKEPAAVPPGGVKHHYAPLAVVVDPASPDAKPDGPLLNRRTMINRAVITTLKM